MLASSNSAPKGRLLSNVLLTHKVNNQFHRRKLQDPDPVPDPGARGNACCKSPQPRPSVALTLRGREPRRAYFVAGALFAAAVTVRVVAEQPRPFALRGPYEPGHSTRSR